MSNIQWFNLLVNIREKKEVQKFLNEHGEAGYGMLSMLCEALFKNILQYDIPFSINTKKEWSALLCKMHHHKLHKYFSSLSSSGVFQIEVLSKNTDTDIAQYVDGQPSLSYPPSNSAYPPSSSTYPLGSSTIYPHSNFSYPPGSKAYPPGKTSYPPGNFDTDGTLYHDTENVCKDDLIKISLYVTPVGTTNAIAHTPAPAFNINIYNNIKNDSSKEKEREEKREERREREEDLSLKYKGQGEQIMLEEEVSFGSYEVSPKEASLRDASASLSSFSFLGKTYHSHSKDSDESLVEQEESTKPNENILESKSGKTNSIGSHSHNHPCVSPKWVSDLKETYQPDIVDFVIDFQCERAKSLGVRASKISLALLFECCKTMSDIIRLDGLNLSEVKAACEWGAEDSFWTTNLVSLARLRTLSKNGLKKIHTLCGQHEAHLKKVAKNGPYGDPRFVENFG